MNIDNLTFFGCLALGGTVFFAFMCMRECILLIKNRREIREYNAGEAKREATANRIAAKAVANVAKNAKPAAKSAHRAPTAPVKTQQRAKSAAPVASAPRTSARDQASKKWDLWSDIL